jgi:hypothetical protein
MQHWFIMIIYIVHNGLINANGLNPVADLYPSEQDCQQTLQTLHLGGGQKGICVPVAPMSVNHSNDVQVTQEEWVRARMREISKSTP